MRARSLFALVALLGLLSGCSQRPSPPPREVAPLAAPLDRPDMPPPAARRSPPGTPFTRAELLAPFSPTLAVTTQSAHGDLFPHLEPLAPDGPHYRSATRLHRGQRAFVLPIARNYGIDPQSHSDLTFETTILKPDGTPDGGTLSSVLWQGHVPAASLPLYPATVVSFHAEAHDPVGLYQVVVRVHDHLAGERRDFIHELELIDYTPPELPAYFDANTWFHGYYLNPTPELALSALPRFFAALVADKRAGAIPPLLGFYDQVLRDNAWLLPAFCEQLATAQPDEAFALSLVLGFHLRGASVPPPGIEPSLWARLADFRGHDWPADPDTPLLRAAQLDALWGRFFASGLFAPIQRLLEPLQHTSDLGAAERWRLSLPPAPPDAPSALPDLDDPATPVAVRREILLRTALWSLRANSRQHPLVRDYLERSLRAGELGPGVRILLERVLRPEAAGAGGFSPL
jgi:hypothetical protein